MTISISQLATKSRALLAGSLVLWGALPACAPTANTSVSGPEQLLIPPPMGSIVGSPKVGTVPGIMTVGADGSRQYTIPLEVPTGRMGVQPSLALRYSSNGGNGALGLGWSIDGLSWITPCGKTYARDGLNRRTAYDGADNVCLDGVRLVQSPNSATEYRTDPYTPARIIANGIANGVPTSWTVMAADGSIRTYGSTTDSRIVMPGSDGRGNITTGWALSTLEDRSGNSMKFSYSASYSTTRTNGSSVEVVPTQIDYTRSVLGHAANRSVVFHYDNDNPPSRPDKQASWAGSVAFVSEKLLTSIVMLAPVAPGNPTQGIVRTYKMSYTSSPATTRTVLSTVELCDGFGECLPATTFTYSKTTNAPVFSAAATDSIGDAANPFNPAVGGEGLLTGDVNGDAFDDLIFYSLATKRWNVRLATGNASGAAFGPVQPQPQLRGTLTTRNTIPPARLYDLDCDDKLDFGVLWCRKDCSIFNCPAVCSMESNRSTSVSQTASFAAATPTDFQMYDDKVSLAVLDLDGDGAGDLFLDTPDPNRGEGIFGATVYRNVPLDRWDVVHWPVQDPVYAPYIEAGHLDNARSDLSLYRDLDGDGQADILLAYEDVTQPDDGTGHHPVLYDLLRVRGTDRTVEATAVDLPSDLCRIWLDANGDGLLDVTYPARGETYVNYGGHFTRSLAAVPFPIAGCRGRDLILSDRLWIAELSTVIV